MPNIFFPVGFNSETYLMDPHLPKALKVLMQGFGGFGFGFSHSTSCSSVIFYLIFLNPFEKMCNYKVGIVLC